MERTLSELAAHVACEFRGNPEHGLSAVGTLTDAGTQAVTFLANSKYKKYLSETAAGCVILKSDDADAFSGNVIISENPYLMYARIAEYLFPQSQNNINIAPTAVIDASAILGNNLLIAANAVIEADVVIGNDCQIGPGAVVQRGTRLGNRTVLLANVTVCHHIVIGDDCLIHPGAVVGSDGFGLASNAEGEWEKVPQLGSVKLGNKVEIGANSTIDRGAINDTLIADGVKIDNQVMVAHNVEIGEHTAIAAMAGISGSSRIGKHCTLAGASGLVGHITLADYVHITGMTMVTKSIDEAGVYSGNIPSMDNSSWRQNVARFRNLRKMDRRVLQVEKKLDKLISTSSE